MAFSMDISKKLSSRRMLSSHSSTPLLTTGYLQGQHRTGVGCEGRRVRVAHTYTTLPGQSLWIMYYSSCVSLHTFVYKYHSLVTY